MSEQAEPSFDANGYPNSETLGRVRNWPVKDRVRLMQFVGAAWHWREFWEMAETPESYHVSASTGGWSGNEDLIGALAENTLWWALCWLSSMRGGHYEFEVRKA